MCLAPTISELDLLQVRLPKEEKQRVANWHFTPTVVPTIPLSSLYTSTLEPVFGTR